MAKWKYSPSMRKRPFRFAKAHRSAHSAAFRVAGYSQRGGLYAGHFLDETVLPGLEDQPRVVVVAHVERTDVDDVDVLASADVSLFGDC